MFTTLLVVFTSSDRQEGHRVAGATPPDGVGSFRSALAWDAESWDRRHRSAMLESPESGRGNLDITLTLAGVWLVPRHEPISCAG